MKRILYIGAILLTLNIIVGLLLSAYPDFNVCLNSVIIFITTLTIVWINKIRIKTAFKISLTYIIITLGSLECVIGLLSKNDITDNWVIIADLILTVIALILIIAAKYTSLKSDN